MLGGPQAYHNITVKAQKHCVTVLICDEQKHIAFTGSMSIEENTGGKITLSKTYSSRHQIVCSKATEGLPPPIYLTALSRHYSVASFATLQVLSCIHSPGLRCSCCNVVRFCCDHEARNFMTATVVTYVFIYYLFSDDVNNLDYTRRMIG
jgi:hypothetical protein